MPNSNPGSLDWLKTLASLKARLQEKPTPGKAELMAALNLSRPMLRYYQKISLCLDEEAVARIRRAFEAVPSHIFTFNNAQALSELEGRVTDLSGAVQAVLDIALSRQLSTLQIAALVDHLINGKPPSDFDHTQVKKKPRKGKKKPESQDEEIDGNSQPEEPQTGGEWRRLGFRAVIEGAKKFWQWVKPGLHKGFGWYHGFFKKLANFIVPHPSSHSSGNRRISTLPALRSPKGVGGDKPLQALAHWVVYVFLQLFFWDMILGLIPRLKPRLEWPVRWLAHQGLVVFPAAAWAYAQSHLAPAIFIGVLLALALAAAYVKKPAQTLALIAVLGLAWFYGRTWSDNLKLPSFFSKTTPAIPTPIAVPTLVQRDSEKNVKGPLKTPILKTSKGSEAPAGANNPSNDQAAAFNGDDGQKALLEAVIAAFPSNRVIKPCAVIPDSSIGQLMAVNRVGDLAVESEYSLRVGQGGQKILSVTPSATGLTIVTAGGPLGSLLGGGSSIGFYWEDVLTIFCIEMDGPSGKTYLFVLTATNLNQPLVVQCNTPNNLGHLVSAFEYFIKAAQGKYIPVTGMPYLYQGMVLGDEGKIIDLWAGSPADKAQARLGDRVWSINGGAHQTPSALEAQLQALPSGSQEIEVATPKDWEAKEMKESKDKNGKIQPNLSEFELRVP